MLADPPWRDRFPALAQSSAGRPLVYLDSAATTQRPFAVLEAMETFYREDNANPGSALHALARRAHERYESARQTLANFLNAASADEIVWVRGTTEGVNLVASAWARAMLKRNDEILLTVAEHASNLLPWQLVAEEVGARLRFVDVDEEGRVSLEDVDRKLSSRTRLVAFSHVSNVLGYVNPAAEICKRARHAGARVFIDGAQSVPHIPVDVQALGCDFLGFSGHKMLGPMGVGVLWARRELLDEMRPYQTGSNSAHDVDLDSRAFEHGARKFGAGTPNVAGAVGLAAAVHFMNSVGRVELQRHERMLTEHALERLGRIEGLTFLGPKSPDHRIPVFSFVLAGWTPQEVLQRLDAEGIAIRAGDLSSLPLLKHWQLKAAARASCHVYTRREEIDRLAERLQRLSAERRSLLRPANSERRGI
jgi:cysteine desulfurase/selenocysteine lyase